MKSPETAAPGLAILMMNAGVGGAQRAMVNLANSAAARGVKVRICLAERRGSYLDTISPDVEIRTLGRGIRTMVSAIRAEMRRTPNDVFLATQIKPIVAAASAKLLCRQRPPLVIREANRVLDDGAAWYFKLANRLMPMLYRQANAFIAVSSSVADDLMAMKIPSERIHAIANGVNTEAVKDMADAPLEDPWVTESPVPVVLAVGRMTEQKGFDTLLTAFRQVLDARPARLLILGEGKLREQLEAMCSQLQMAEHVRMPGFVDNPYAYMGHSDLFVLSSRWEGSPNALLEALAAGCQSVSTDCPTGPREILTEQRIGTLVPVDDAPAMAKAMLRAFETPAEREAIRRFAKSNHGLSAWVDRYAALFSTLDPRWTNL